MPCQLRWSLPSRITALSPCRLLRVSEERAERLLLSSVQKEIDGQVAMLQGLPLFAWMSKEHVQDLLLHASLQLVPDGEVLVKAGDPVSDASRIHLVVAGKVASALPIETNLPPSSQVHDEAQGAANAPAPQQLRCSLVREQGPGAHVGFSSMARQCASRTTIRSRGSCLVLTMECATVSVRLFCSILLADELKCMSCCALKLTYKPRPHRQMRQACIKNERHDVLDSLKVLVCDACQLLCACALSSSNTARHCSTVVVLV